MAVPLLDLRALEADKRKRTQKAKEESESVLTREQLAELRDVQRERVQMGKMKILGMETRVNMGVRMDGTGFE